MPVELERRLQTEAKRKIKTRADIKGNEKTVKEARAAYVYGGMRDTGWKPGEPGTKWE